MSVEPAPAVPRWVGWLGATVFIGLLAVALVWWLQLRGAPPTAVTAAASDGLASPPASAAAHLGATGAPPVDVAVDLPVDPPADPTVGSRAGRPQPTVASGKAAPVPDAQAGPTQVTVEVCGLGDVVLSVPPPGDPQSPAPQQPEEPPVPPALGAPARAAVWPDLLAAMAAAPDPRVQAAGWMLRASGAHLEDTPGVSPSLRQQERALATQALARLASTSSDWTLWAWALSTCHRARAQEPAACSGITPEAAARQVPDEANAWLTLAAGQPAGSPEQAASMARAATSARVGGAGFALAAAVDQAWPVGQPAYLHESFMVIAIGVQAAMVDFSGFSAMRWCVPDPAQGVPAERRATCDALARLLHEQGQDLTAAGAARSLARRLDWPAAQQQAMEDESRRLNEAVVSASTAHLPFSCASSSWTRQWVRDAHRLGERAAARAMLARPAEAAASAAPAPGARVPSSAPSPARSSAPTPGAPPR